MKYVYKVQKDGKTIETFTELQKALDAAKLIKAIVVIVPVSDKE